jgi:hypothetical protein
MLKGRTGFEMSAECRITCALHTAQQRIASVSLH